MLDAPPTQLPAHRQAGLAAPDDDDGQPPPGERADLGRTGVAVHGRLLVARSWRGCQWPAAARGAPGQGHHRSGRQPIRVEPAFLEVMKDATSSRNVAFEIDFGGRETRLGPGTGELLTRRIDHLCVAEEAQLAHPAGLVRGDQKALVLRRPCHVVQVEEPGLTIGRQLAGPLRHARGPGREAGDEVGAVQRQTARGFGKRLVVVDEHPDTPDRRIERAELVAGGVPARFPRRLMHFAMAAEDPVSGQADRRVETLVADLLRVSDADHDVTGDGPQGLEDRVAGGEGRRQLVRARIGEIGEIAAEHGMREHQ